MAFGVRWQSEIALPVFPDSPDAGAADVTVRMGEPLPASWLCPAPGAKIRIRKDGFRYLHEAEVAIDVSPPGLIEIQPGPDFPGSLPAPFFATVTALLMALRGCVPLHGSAVEMDGTATLICGAAGAGKSTCAARLIAQGARLISDDLSVLYPGWAGEAALLYAGRRTMRLYPAAAEALGRAVTWTAAPFESLGKIAVSPPQVAPEVGVPLTKVVVLGHPDGPLADAGAVLAAHMFRPQRQAQLPGYGMRRIALALAARTMEVRGGNLA